MLCMVQDIQYPVLDNKDTVNNVEFLIDENTEISTD